MGCDDLVRERMSMEGLCTWQSVSGACQHSLRTYCLLDAGVGAGIRGWGWWDRRAEAPARTEVHPRHNPLTRLSESGKGRKKI